MSTATTTHRFSHLLIDYATVIETGDLARMTAAATFPQADTRATAIRYREQREGMRLPTLRARSWVASIEDAARELHNLVVIHDNGGTASSPKKIKNAARELLRLIGEG